MNNNRIERFRGLTWKIFAVFVLCMLIPMLISLFTSSYLSQKYLTDSSSNALLNIAGEKRNQIYSVKSC